MLRNPIMHRALVMLIVGVGLTFERPGFAVAQELTPSGCKRATVMNLTSVLDAVSQEICPCGCGMPLATCNCADAKKIKAARLPGGVPPMIIPGPPGGSQPGTPGGGPQPTPPPVAPPGGAPGGPTPGTPSPRGIYDEFRRSLSKSYQAEEARLEQEINDLYEQRRRFIHEEHAELERLKAEQARELQQHEQRIKDLESRAKNAQYQYDEALRELAELDAMTLFDKKLVYGSAEGADNYEMGVVAKKSRVLEDAVLLNLELNRERRLQADTIATYYARARLIRDERDLTIDFLDMEARSKQRFLEMFRRLESMLIQE
jgi:hypothetical protein